MSNKNFSRRRRRNAIPPQGRSRAKPAKNRPRRHASARRSRRRNRAADERLFEKRHAQEIERAENIAAGLPPEGRAGRARRAAPHGEEKKDFREPHLETPAGVEEEKFEPVPIKEQPKGLVESIKSAADEPRQKSSAAHPPGKENPQGSHHQRRDARNARRGVGRRQARGIQHRAHHRGTPRRQHFQGQGPQSRRRT